MNNLIRLTDFSRTDILHVFEIADEISRGGYKDYLLGKSFILFFPTSSIRTRVTFEKGIHQLGGQSILFPSDSLDKKEEIKDVISYLNNWADCIIVRHPNINLLSELITFAKIPIINAMTNHNHPCEILTDLYSLSKIRKDYLNAEYLFMGARGNIGLTWREAAKVLDLHFTQCCPKGYEMEEIAIEYNIEKAIQGKDIILTDSFSGEQSEDFRRYQITKELMSKANEHALLNPCPPFFRGEEVSADAIDSTYFVGYEFKKSLLEVQQAIIIYCMIG